MKKTNLKSVVFFTRKTIYLALASIDKLLGRENKLVILCYHSISDNGWRFSIPVSQVQKQMEFMTKHFTPVTLSDIGKSLRGEGKITRPAFAVTFDDGYQDLLVSKKLFKNLGIAPTVFLISHKDAINRSVLGCDLPLLTNLEVKKLKKYGWEIGSHGATHSILTNSNKRKLKQEIKESKSKLEKTFFGKVKSFAYPKGRYSPAVVEMVAKAGYEYGLSMDDRIISPASSLLTLPRVGVDGSHSFSEFQVLSSPSVVAFRNLVKQSVLGRFL